MKIDDTAGGTVPEPSGGAVRVLGQGEHVESTVTVRTTDHDGCPVTAVAGEIDSHSVTPVEAELSAQLDRHPGALVLDLNAVGFMASAGVTMLLNAHHHAAANGVSLAVVADQRQVLRLLAITELDRVFTIHPTVAAALDAVQALPS